MSSYKLSYIAVITIAAYISFDSCTDNDYDLSDIDN